MYRRYHKETVNAVLEAIKVNIDGPSTNLGYLSIHQKLVHNGIKRDRETVRLCLKIIDPEGVKRRKAHKRKRWVYESHGPNFMWHIDGCDKLKPFGFLIHGAIDGCSRKILWLNICPSNSDPYIISYFYVNCISNLKCIPWGDRGSENVFVAGMLRYFRGEHQDSMFGRSSFLFGSSTNNQWIEKWWSILKRQNSARLINFFKDSLFDPSLNYHKEYMKFCFSGMLQNELDNIKEMWSNYGIRNSRNAECSGGRPDVLCFNPATAGATN